MDLDSRTYSKLTAVRHSDVNFEKYRRIGDALALLFDRRDHETPEMWCSRIRDPFRKILKENLGVLSGNGYISMCGKLIERSDRVHRLPSNYIYCSVCDSLVFIANSLSSGDSYRDNHFKGCINRDIISNEHARIKDIFQSIDEKEFIIWKYKQFILREEAEMKRFQLELFSQSTSHSEKDKLASVSYDDGSGLADYETYLSAKATVAKNTMLSVPNFEPACISLTSGNQEVISPNSYHVLNRSTPPPLPQKSVALMGSLERDSRQRSASAPEIRNLWNDRSNMPNIYSRTTLGDLAEAYFDSVRKNARR